MQMCPPKENRPLTGGRSVALGFLLASGPFFPVGQKRRRKLEGENGRFEGKTSPRQFPPVDHARSTDPRLIKFLRRDAFAGKLTAGFFLEKRKGV